MNLFFAQILQTILTFRFFHFQNAMKTNINARTTVHAYPKKNNAMDSLTAQTTKTKRIAVSRNETVLYNLKIVRKASRMGLILTFCEARTKLPTTYSNRTDITSLYGGEILQNRL